MLILEGFWGFLGSHGGVLLGADLVEAARSAARDQSVEGALHPTPIGPECLRMEGWRFKNF